MSHKPFSLFHHRTVGRSKAVVLLLLIYFYGGFVMVFVSVFIALCPFWFCNHIDEEEKAGCFAIIVFRMSCYCKRPVGSSSRCRGLVCSV